MNRWDRGWRGWEAWNWKPEQSGATLGAGPRGLSALVSLQFNSHTLNEPSMGTPGQEVQGSLLGRAGVGRRGKERFQGAKRVEPVVVEAG